MKSLLEGYTEEEEEKPPKIKILNKKEKRENTLALVDGYSSKEEMPDTQNDDMTTHWRNYLKQNGHNELVVLYNQAQMYKTNKKYGRSRDMIRLAESGYKNTISSINTYIGFHGLDSWEKLMNNDVF